MDRLMEDGSIHGWRGAYDPATNLLFSVPHIIYPEDE